MGEAGRVRGRVAGVHYVIGILRFAQDDNNKDNAITDHAGDASPDIFFSDYTAGIFGAIGILRFAQDDNNKDKGNQEGTPGFTKGELTIKRKRARLELCPLVPLDRLPSRPLFNLQIVLHGEGAEYLRCADAGNLLVHWVRDGAVEA